MMLYEIIKANFITGFKWIKSFFTNIDYIKILYNDIQSDQLYGNKIIKYNFFPLFFKNNFKKMEIKHINSQRKFIISNFDNINHTFFPQNEHKLLIQLKIDNGINLSEIFNDYVDETKIIDILSMNKILFNSNSKLSVILFDNEPIYKWFYLHDIYYNTIGSLKI